MKKNLIAVGIIVLAVAIPLAFTVYAVYRQQTNREIHISRVHATQTASSALHFPNPGGRMPIDLSPTPGSYPHGMPYVQGAQVLDSNGRPLLLRGAQIESPFNYIQGWQAGHQISSYLNPTIFTTMAQNWKMNVLRLPISNWIYAKDPATYLGRLDQVIQQANSAGLYVVLDLHDDGKSGSPYGDLANLPKAENVSFWHAIAGHYKNNPMVMFDLFNEPKSPTWPIWMHGGGKVGGATVVGFQDLVNAVRTAGARQIIVLEPGSAGGNSYSDSGWASVGSNIINDPNLMYSLHVYQGLLLPPQQLDVKWGPILNHHPIYYGEWALLPNANKSGKCDTIVHSQADQDVLNFLNYMQARHANWTAWQFTPYHLIQDYTAFTPTSLDIPWTCGDTSSHAGMGTLVKQFLTT